MITALAPRSQPTSLLRDWRITSSAPWWKLQIGLSHRLLLPLLDGMTGMDRQITNRQRMIATRLFGCINNAVPISAQSRFCGKEFFFLRQAAGVALGELEQEQQSHLGVVGKVSLLAD